MRNISYDQAFNLINMYDVLIIDVQAKNEYDKKHLVGSINVPVEEINEKVPQIIKNFNQIIIVYCLTGIRSIAAYDMLLRLGYSNVYNIQGGIDGEVL